MLDDMKLLLWCVCSLYSSFILVNAYPAREKKRSINSKFSDILDVRPSNSENSNHKIPYLPVNSNSLSDDDDINNNYGYNRKTPWKRQGLITLPFYNQSKLGKSNSKFKETRPPLSSFVNEAGSSISNSFYPVNQKPPMPKFAGSNINTNEAYDTAERDYIDGNPYFENADYFRTGNDVQPDDSSKLKSKSFIGNSNHFSDLPNVGGDMQNILFDNEYDTDLDPGPFPNPAANFKKSYIGNDIDESYNLRVNRIPEKFRDEIKNVQQNNQGRLNSPESSFPLQYPPVVQPMEPPFQTNQMPPYIPEITMEPPFQTNQMPPYIPEINQDMGNVPSGLNVDFSDKEPLNRLGGPQSENGFDPLPNFAPESLGNPFFGNKEYTSINKEKNPLGSIVPNTKMPDWSVGKDNLTNPVIDYDYLYNDSSENSNENPKDIKNVSSRLSNESDHSNINGLFHSLTDGVLGLINKTKDLFLVSEALTTQNTPIANPSPSKSFSNSITNIADFFQSSTELSTSTLCSLEIEECKELYITVFGTNETQLKRRDSSGKTFPFKIQKRREKWDEKFPSMRIFRPDRNKFKFNDGPPSRMKVPFSRHQKNPKDFELFFKTYSLNEKPHSVVRKHIERGQGEFSDPTRSQKINELNPGSLREFDDSSNARKESRNAGKDGDSAIESRELENIETKKTVLVDNRAGKMTDISKKVNKQVLDTVWAIGDKRVGLKEYDDGFKQQAENEELKNQLKSLDKINAGINPVQKSEPTALDPFPKTQVSPMEEGKGVDKFDSSLVKAGYLPGSSFVGTSEYKLVESTSKASVETTSKIEQNNTEKNMPIDWNQREFEKIFSRRPYSEGKGEILDNNDRSKSNQSKVRQSEDDNALEQKLSIPSDSEDTEIEKLIDRQEQENAAEMIRNVDLTAFADGNPVMELPKSSGIAPSTKVRTTGSSGEGSRTHFVEQQGESFPFGAPLTEEDPEMKRIENLVKDTNTVIKSSNNMIRQKSRLVSQRKTNVRNNQKILKESSVQEKKEHQYPSTGDDKNPNIIDRDEMNSASEFGKEEGMRNNKSNINLLSLNLRPSVEDISNRKYVQERAALSKEGLKAEKNRWNEEDDDNDYFDEDEEDEEDDDKEEESYDDDDDKEDDYDDYDEGQGTQTNKEKYKQPPKLPAIIPWTPSKLKTDTNVKTRTLDTSRFDSKKAIDFQNENKREEARNLNNGLGSYSNESPEFWKALENTVNTEKHEDSITEIPNHMFDSSKDGTVTIYSALGRPENSLVVKNSAVKAYDPGEEPNVEKSSFRDEPLHEGQQKRLPENQFITSTSIETEDEAKRFPSSIPHSEFFKKLSEDLEKEEIESTEESPLNNNAFRLKTTHPELEQYDEYESDPIENHPQRGYFGYENDEGQERGDGGNPDMIPSKRFLNIPKHRIEVPKNTVGHRKKFRHPPTYYNRDDDMPERNQMNFEPKRKEKQKSFWNTKRGDDAFHSKFGTLLRNVDLNFLNKWKRHVSEKLKKLRRNSMSTNPAQDDDKALADFEMEPPVTFSEVKPATERNIIDSGSGNIVYMPVTADTDDKDTDTNDFVHFKE